MRVAVVTYMPDVSHDAVGTHRREGVEWPKTTHTRRTWERYVTHGTLGSLS